MARDEFGPLGHGWTYSAHPIGAAAGVANLEVVDKLDLVSNAKVTGAYLNRQMRSALADHENVGDIRGEGMLCAVELVQNRHGRQFFDPSKKVAATIVGEMVKHGVIARAMPQGDIIGFAPPLCLSEDEADKIVAVTRQVVEAELS